MKKVFTILAIVSVIGMVVAGCSKPEDAPTGSGNTAGTPPATTAGK